MKTVTPALANHLGQSTTSLCRLLKITRNDGTVYRYTDHDQDLTYPVAAASVAPTMTEVAGLNSSNRTSGTVYQNTTGFPLLVMPLFTGSGYGNWTDLEAITDSSPSPTTVVSCVPDNAYGGGGMMPPMIVMPGHYYKVNPVTLHGGGGAFYDNWREFTFSESMTASANLAGTGRVIGGTYQNTSGSVMFLVAYLTGVGSSASYLSILSDSSSTPTTQIFGRCGLVSSVGGDIACVTAISPILPGDYYTVNNYGVGTLASWMEYTWGGVTATRASYTVGSSRLLSHDYSNAGLLWVQVDTMRESQGDMWLDSTPVGHSGEDQVCDLTVMYNNLLEGETDEATVFGPVLPTYTYQASGNAGGPHTSGNSPFWWEWTFVAAAPVIVPGTYLSLDGLTFKAVQHKSDASPNNTQVTGFITPTGINENDIRARLYDNAVFELRAVNWQDLTMGDVKMLSGPLGDIQMKNGEYQIELRGWTQKLTSQIGSTYGPVCRAELFGGGIEGINPTSHWKCQLNRADWVQTGTVGSSPDEFTIVPSEAGSPPAPALFQIGPPYPGTELAPAGWFNDGIITFTSGVLNGYTFQIANWDGTTLTLFSGTPMPQQPAAGDTYEIEPGCDKTRPTCHAKFNNAINFAGEADIPGLGILGQCSYSIISE